MKFLVLPLLLVLFLAGCGADTTSSDGASAGAPTASIHAYAPSHAQYLSGEIVRFSGLASTDPQGDELTYVWALLARPAGSEAELTETAQPVKIELPTDAPGAYQVELTVTDSEANQSNSITEVNVIPWGPSANAGVDANGFLSESIQLTGAYTSLNPSDIYTYSWRIKESPANSAGVFDNAAAQAPTFTAGTVGDYLIELTVSDGLNPPGLDELLITLVEVDQTPDPGVPEPEIPDPGVLLYSKHPLLNEYSAVTWPYSLNSSSNITVVGATETALGKFKLKAQGDNYTVVNLSAVDANGYVVTSFSGITPGIQLSAGTETDFSLVSTLTGGLTSNITFSFEIQETGETFTAHYTFTSN